MSRRSNRPRGRGSRPFVMFYTDTLQHLNFRRLSPRAVKLLMNVSASYSGFNNGDLAVTLTVMEPFGWKSNDQLRKALSELMHYGFLVKTRQGGRNLCSLYALGWHAIDHCKGKHDAMEPPPLISGRSRLSFSMHPSIWAVARCLVRPINGPN